MRPSVEAVPGRGAKTMAQEGVSVPVRGAGVFGYNCGRHLESYEAPSWFGDDARTCVCRNRAAPMKRRILIAVPLLSLVVIVAWVLRPKHEKIGESFISERSATLWSGVAQVREPVSVLHYGERVDVLSRRNDSVKVRTAEGQVGWID